MKKIILKIESYLRQSFVKYSRWYFHLKEIIGYSEPTKNMINADRFVRMNKIQGDYAEFGVSHGGFLISMYHLARVDKNKDRKIYAFDTFSGFPKPEDVDTYNNGLWKEGSHAFSLKNLKKRFKRNMIDLDKVIFVEGIYKDTLKHQHNKNKLAFIHIDCDYYSSARDVMKYIKPLLQEGTVILFDNWYCFKADKDQGEQRAYYEFLKENPSFEFIDLPVRGLEKMFICRKVGGTKLN